MRQLTLLLLLACQPRQAQLDVVAPPQLTLTGDASYVASDSRLKSQKALAQDSQTRALRLDHDGSLRTLQLRDLQLPAAESDETFARQAVTHFAAALGIAEQATDALHFALERVRTDPLGKTHVRFRQIYRGYAVDDRSLDVHFRKDRVSSLTGSPAAESSFDPPVVAVADAEALARARLADDRVLTATERLLYVPWQGRYRLAFEVVLATPDHQVDRRVLIDAQTGNVLGEEDRVARGHAEGYVYPINDVRGGREWLPLVHLQVGDAVTAMDGTFAATGQVQFTLSGPYANVINDDRARYAYAGPADARVQFDLLDGAAGELAAFVHVNEARDWFAQQLAFTLLDKPIQTHVRAGDCLFNAYASGTSELTFGAGCGLYDYAQSADYVYHEYGHLVTNVVSDLAYSTRSEAGAFAEGQSDYWACTMTNDSHWGESPLPYLFDRQCDNDFVYAKNYSGEAHNGGQLHSGSLWDLRKQFGADVSDHVALYLLYSLPQRPTLLDVRDAAIEADYTLYQSAHEAAIGKAYDRHGINDERIVFMTDDVNFTQRAPITATLSAHAQGFDRKSVHYEWQFQDGTRASGDEVQHRFTETPASVTLVVSDATGLVLTASASIGSCNAASPGLAAWVVLAALAARFSRREGRREFDRRSV